MDCHEQWHALAASYMEPESFRMSLNNLIQSLRNVTWLLQKQKAQLKNFDTWYNAWRASTSDDAVMRWVVTSRNRIVKEADLDLHSGAYARLSFDWLHEISSSWTLPARYTSRDILIRLLSTHPYLTEGILTIERRWIDKRLPDDELLDALRYAYASVAQVVIAAHNANGVGSCDIPGRARECITADIRMRPECMHDGDKSRRLHVNLRTRTEFTEDVAYLPADPELSDRAVARYGDARIHGDAVAHVPQLVPTVQNMLAADKSLATVAHLLKGDRTVDLVALVFPDHDSKRLTMQVLAERARRYGADGVVIVSEIWWIDYDHDKDDLDDPNFVRPSDRPDRREAFQILGVTRDGRQADVLVPFSRSDEGEILFSEPIYDIGGKSNLIEPIKRMWDAGEDSP